MFLFITALILGIMSNTNASNKMKLPVIGRITSPFGNRVRNGKTEFHNGIDISAVTGTEIKAPADGICIKQYSNATGGNQMIVKHDNGFTSGYAHLHSFNIAVGQRFVQGQVIARVGNTGMSSGSHLHLTLRNAQLQAVNPLDYMTT